MCNFLFVLCIILYVHTDFLLNATDNELFANRAKVRKIETENTIAESRPI